MIEEFDSSKFSLVLSGGGALGIAHLGVLHDIQKQALVPSEIIGTSMGGIVGACMAIGMSEADIYAQLDSFASVTKWIKFGFGGNAIIEHDRLEKIFDGMFGSRGMGDTDIPLKLITTHLETGAKRVFDASDNVLLKDAVLATMAIPGVFEARVIEGEVYGDGFLCENLGIMEASLENVLAVDVLGSGSFVKELPDSIFKSANVLEMLERSMRILIYTQTQTNLSHSGKNILLLEPDTSQYKTFHFHKIDEIRELGVGLLYT